MATFWLTYGNIVVIDNVIIDGAGNVFYDASGITQLGAGESAVDTFTYWVTDEHGRWRKPRLPSL